MKCFFFFFFFFENIVDSPLNQSRITTGVPVKNVKLPTLQTKSTHSTAQVKEPTQPPPPPPPKKKKLYTPNIGVLRTSQKHWESNRVNVIFSGQHLQVRAKYALCKVTWNRNIVPGENISAKLYIIPRHDLIKYLSFFYLFNK